MNNNISTTTISSIVIQLNSARSLIQAIGQPILFTIGMIGTLLNIAIFSRRSMRQNSCALYFHATSWANFFCLTWGVFASMLVFFTQNDPASYNIVYCKIRSYILAFAQVSSRVFLILTCLDRFLLCSRSVRQRNFCRPKIAKIMIFLTTLICACLTSSVLISYKIGEYIITCTVSTTAASIYGTALTWLFILAIPTISMIIFSLLIIKRLKQNAKRVGHDHIHVAGKDVQLVSMLIGQGILYLMTNLPFASLVLYGNLAQSVPQSSKSAERIAIESLLSTIFASFLYYCFNALTFYVYTLTAPSFRHELLKMILPRQFLRKIEPPNHPQTRMPFPLTKMSQIDRNIIHSANQRTLQKCN